MLEKMLPGSYGNSYMTPFILSGKVIVVLDMSHEAAYGLIDPL